VDKSREQFLESFEEMTGWEFEDYPNKSERDFAWEMWQASRVAAEVEIPGVEKWRSPEAVRAQRAMLVLVKQAISDSGLKVKGE